MCVNQKVLCCITKTKWSILSKAGWQKCFRASNLDSRVSSCAKSTVTSSTCQIHRANYRVVFLWIRAQTSPGSSARAVSTGHCAVVAPQIRRDDAPFRRNGSAWFLGQEATRSSDDSNTLVQTIPTEWSSTRSWPAPTDLRHDPQTNNRHCASSSQRHNGRATHVVRRWVHPTPVLSWATSWACGVVGHRAGRREFDTVESDATTEFCHLNFAVAPATA